MFIDVSINQLLYHQVDPDNGLVFYEPVIYGQLLSGNYTGSGLDRVPGGDQYRDQSVYSWHAYCWALEFVDANATDEDRIEAKEFCIDQLLPQVVIFKAF